MDKIGNLVVRNTKDLLGPDTRLCALMWAKAKFGKTKWAAALDKITKRWYNGPSLVVAVEAADGGGTATLADLGLDYVEPKSFGEFQGLVAALQTDTTYKGIILDNASDLVKRFIQVEALKLPYEKGTAPMSRQKGVPAQGDYQTMGEMLRSELNKLVNLTKKDTDARVRKHLIVTALEYEKTSRDGQTVLSVGPALPGQMADTATAMFQAVLTIEVEQKVKVNPANPKETVRYNERVVVCEADGKRILGDRLNVFPTRGTFDLEKVWEEFWIPKMGLEVETKKVEVG
jgi:hypothetical protein